ncbi:hypothetical protein WICMUC_002055 [Wickerhamomyces mucosus]|uniref:Mannosyltransferase n=1 Tax=Wickerhamomyces mucosus TaxID=1378264 RepID=A0A9P8PSC7_9ASCO|nr:hypothetical protein WICMUC_002055 [Wickerhamomyces mucosus]
MFSMIFDPFIFIIIGFYAVAALFTKVEESFNMHAIHDFLYHGLDVSKFDHNEFPGAVPRTFIGSIVISSIVKPILHYVPEEISKIDVSFMCRVTLGIFNGASLIYLKNVLYSVIKKHDRNIEKNDKSVKIIEKVKTKQSKDKSIKPATRGKQSPAERIGYRSFSFWFAIIQFSQFHLIYYASRTLPNFFALPLTNIAFAQLYKGNFSTSISILAFTTIVFRIELVALTLSVGLFLFYYKKLTIDQLIRAGSIGGIIGALLSGTVDSYFWKRFTIPEIGSFLFNVVEGKSSEWGTDPFYTYFTRVASKLFLPPYVPLLAVFGYFFEPTGNQTLKISVLASLLYIFLLSFQPHKEWRFIVYTIPVFNLAGANGATVIFSKSFKSVWYRLLLPVILGSAALSLLLSTLWVQVSLQNYPGGQAMYLFYSILRRGLETGLIEPSSNITAYIDVTTKMTGATLFADLSTGLPVNINYDKSESPEDITARWNTFDYLITAHKDPETLLEVDGYKWEKLETAQAYAGINPKMFGKVDFVKVAGTVWSDKSLIPFYLATQRFLDVQDAICIYGKTKIEETEDGEKSQDIEDYDNYDDQEERDDEFGYLEENYKIDEQDNSSFKTEEDNSDDLSEQNGFDYQRESSNFVEVEGQDEFNFDIQEEQDNANYTEKHHASEYTEVQGSSEMANEQNRVGNSEEQESFNFKNEQNEVVEL